MEQFACELLDLDPRALRPIGSISSYPLRFPLASQVTAALNCPNRIHFTTNVLDFALGKHSIGPNRLPNKCAFWYTVFNSEEHFWLWENEDERELEQFVRKSTAYLDDPVSVSDLDDFISRGLQDCSKQINGAGRLAYLKSSIRIQFLTWLFIAMARFVKDGITIRVCETIVTWSRFFHYGPAISHDTHCGCNGQALKYWVNIMLQVYSVADLGLMPWGSSCNCLNAELRLRSPSVLEKNGPVTCPALYRFLFKMFIPAWPSILWVLFRMLREDDEPELVPTFLSILRSEENRDLLVWDAKDQEFISSSLQHFKMGPLTLDWHRYVSEIEPTTWGMINSLTRVERRSSVRYDPPMRICAFALMASRSLNIPQPIAAAFHIDSAAEYWVQFAHITSPTYAREPQLFLHSIRSEQFWSSSQLKSWLKMAARDRCFDIFHTPRYTMLERVQFISFILNNQQVNINPLSHSLCVINTVGSQWLTSTGYVEDSSSVTVLSFRSDFRALLEMLKIEIQQRKPTVVTHTWAANLCAHAVECLIYLTARFVDSLQIRDGYDGFLRETNAQEMLDLLQDLLDLDAFSVIRPMLFKAMCRLSRASNLYPRCFTLTGLHKVGTQVAGGGYGDIWKGLVRGQSVCVKMLRIFQDSDIAMAVKEFGAEAIIWRQLCHPNVLPFFGLYYIDQRLCLISPWMQNGNIMEFLTANSPDTPRRFSMILDIASGLEYLHSQNTIHGDLKGINILVSPSGRACIADFGLSIVVNAMTLRLTTSTIVNRGGTARYHAPELFDTGVKTFASDIYAFGCVAYEIMTGTVPFRELSNDMQIMFRVLKGERPERLPSCTGTPALDSVWELVEMCWDAEKEKRPQTDEINKRLIQVPIAAATTLMQSDWDDQFTAKFRRSINMQPLLPSVNELEHMVFGEGKTEPLLFVLVLTIPEELAKRTNQSQPESAD
ncbi:kinase domain-containing protein [Favolaschia claudopus]|uniref:Kinase domain-containing protein n=1 Tax=Favolaschia claudopus TaxID=2862362 RepID=A0AAV9ZVI5_9AGAR